LLLKDGFTAKVSALNFFFLHIPTFFVITISIVTIFHLKQKDISKVFIPLAMEARMWAQI